SPLPALPLRFPSAWPDWRVPGPARCSPLRRAHRHAEVRAAVRGWTWSSGLSVRAAVRALAPLGLLFGLAACGGKGTEPTPVCTFTIAPPSQELPGAGGEASVTVTASAASCTWTAGTAA